MNHQSPRARNAYGAQSAFTLIELLVVIAIIAILAAILFPVFAQAREKARQTACLNNCKQMAIAIQMYTEDYDETLPFASYKVLQPYTKNNGIFLCPSEANERLARTRTDISPVPVSYNVNRVVLPFPENPSSGRTQRIMTLAGLDQPSSTIAIADRRTVDIAPGTTNTDQGVVCYDSNRNPMTVAMALDLRQPCGGRLQYDRHNGGMTCVFVDGHAKWSRMENTITPTFMWGPPRMP
jgi:prepilin-type N-terminal cleavage/methylation domain-containing protein/prepilin-type processing-associated H-X9-DG protein